ncbi:hypothetical protein CP532_2610 [Ophiocordyceps camponoti-leonardi (nom. inval.)]|nr:hypothetical protein CP532_2610 [Ophiocordyceps camponoti-leonardi (nom. inval.)]
MTVVFRRAFSSSASLLLSVALVFFLCASLAAAAATTSAEKDVPQWASDNALQLTLSTKPGLQFTTIPLTENLGLNESDRVRGVVRIYGALKPANVSNYNQINGQDDIAYLSCDKPAGDNLISPDKMLNDLMAQRPKAILLYSTNRNWCSIDSSQPLAYTSILTMADAGEAGNVQGYVGGNNAAAVKAIIQGNAPEQQTVNNDSGAAGGGGNNSAVAMSILYSITGLITLLFLIIIATGAIRAHRYPERYGPRGAFGGRPRQSRAKGLARAVLDTIPIVKFGNQEPSKPDPQLELETTTTNMSSGAVKSQTKTVSRLPEIRPAVSAGAATTTAVDATGAATAATTTATTAMATTTATTTTATTPPPPPPTAPRPRRYSQDSQVSALTVSDMEEPEPVREGEDAVDTDGNLGCSICTEDFCVGEDVRVLPCNHQFHPNCVDPWLVNVSGTCPLCRLDLRPGHDSAGNGSPADDGDLLAPPLALETEDGGSNVRNSHGNRFSRLLDVNRLRQASVEERMEALRQMRTRNDGDWAAGSRRAQGQSLTMKLKDKFRVRTRPQVAAERRRL